MACLPWTEGSSVECLVTSASRHLLNPVTAGALLARAGKPLVLSWVGSGETQLSVLLPKRWLWEQSDRWEGCDVSRASSPPRLVQAVPRKGLTCLLSPLLPNPVRDHLCQGTLLLHLKRSVKRVTSRKRRKRKRVKKLLWIVVTKIEAVLTEGTVEGTRGLWHQHVALPPDLLRGNGLGDESEIVKVDEDRVPVVTEVDVNTSGWLGVLITRPCRYIDLHRVPIGTYLRIAGA